VTIRVRLLLGFVLVVLLLAALIGAGSVVIGYRNGKQQAVDRLHSVAALKELQIRDWSRLVQENLALALNEEYALERASLVLKLSGDFRYSEYYFSAVRNRFIRFIGHGLPIETFSLLNLDGEVILSTDPTMEGKPYSDPTFLARGLRKPFTRLSFPETGGGKPFAEAAIPVTDQNGQPLGILAGRASLADLGVILGERFGAGQTGKVYLVDSARNALTGGGAPPGGIQSLRDIHSAGIDAALTGRDSASAAYSDHLGVRVLGVYRWLPELEAALLVEQDQAEAYHAVLATLNINIVIALLAAGLAAIASLVFTRDITAPLIHLVHAATRIAAGDLEHQAIVDRKDEVGTLASAFNLMTAQLRDSINGLEQRVAQRTFALQHRAVQLETSAHVSREITSILDIDTLLSRVVELIHAAFHYYCVHIFLVDANGQCLELRASSGAFPPQHHRLSIGRGSLNGETVITNEAVLVDDVAADPRFLVDDALPETRAELIIPLRMGERVIGTLDVQSAELNAFTSEDVLVIQSLGDQIAIAIENARLYDQSRALAVVQERNRLAREFHDSVTQSLYALVVFAGAAQDMIQVHDLAALRNQIDRMEKAAQQSLKEMRLLLYELRPPVEEKIGLAGALQQRLAAVEQRTGMDAQVTVACSLDLPAEMEQGLFRIAQEALNNTLKHAQARMVSVRVYADAGRIELEVSDDGGGFRPEEARRRGGFGLAMMRERAEQLGGTLSITSAPGAGTRVLFVRDGPRTTSGHQGRIT
jgi:nitrate/nitrite-specific signal transduction histidine kinase